MRTGRVAGKRVLITGAARGMGRSHALRLDAAVANAGVLTAATWDDTTPEQWRTVVDVNLIGTWNTCAAALPHLVERGGSLVDISSAAGLEGTPLHTRTRRPSTASSG